MTTQATGHRLYCLVRFVPASDFSRHELGLQKVVEAFRPNFLDRNALVGLNSMPNVSFRPPPPPAGSASAVVLTRAHGGPSSGHQLDLQRLGAAARQSTQHGSTRDGQA